MIKQAIIDLWSAWRRADGRVEPNGPSPASDPFPQGAEETKGELQPNRVLSPRIEAPETEVCPICGDTDGYWCSLPGCPNSWQTAAPSSGLPDHRALHGGEA